MELEKQRVFIPNVFQREALKILENTKENKGVIVMPTGTGKTFLASLWFKKQLESNSKAKLLFICHNRDILSQANEKEFQNCLKGLEITYGYYNAKEKDIQQATFGTVQTLTRNLNEFSKDYFDYIIVDEAHHYQARSFKKVIEYFKPKFLLGLTATPNRMDKKDIYKICGKKVYEAKINDAIKKGLLTKINYWCVDNDIDYSDVKWNGNNYDEKDLNRKICIKEYDDAILKEYRETLKEKFKKTKTICFCATVEHTHRMAKLFNDNGIKAVGLTGKYFKEDYRVTIHDNQRDEIIKGFRNGKYDIIFVRDLFNEGVNIPDCDSVMLLRPTQSHTIFTQQIGRGLRVSEGKDNVLILDFTGNARKCNINFEVLEEIAGEKIIDKAINYNKTKSQNNNEIIIISNGIKVRFSRKKINILTSYRNDIMMNLKTAIKKYHEIYKEKPARGQLKKENQAIYKHFRKNKLLDKYCLESTHKDLNQTIKKYHKIYKEKPYRSQLHKENLAIYNHFHKNKLLDEYCLPKTKLNLKQTIKKFKEIYKEKPSRGQLSKENMGIYKHFRKNKLLDKYCLDAHSGKKSSNIKIISSYKPKTIIIPTKQNRKGLKKNYEGLHKEEYKSKVDKIDIREKIISKINDGDNVLLLESPDLSALKEIEKQNKKPNKIIIPNNKEFKKLVNAIQNYKTDLNIEIVNTSILQYLVDSEEKFDFLWLDYCGAFSYYMKDLDILFSKKFNNIKLVLTYNLFDPAKEDENYYFTRVIDYVLSKNEANKIRLMNDVSYRYKKNMYNIGFNIQKVN